MKGKLPYHILAFLVVAIWGITFVCTKVLIQAGLTPAQIFFCRFVIAYLGIWFLTIFNRDQAKLFAKTVKDELVFIFLGITGGSLYFLTENSSLYFTQACNVAFLVSSAPLMTLILTMTVRKLGRGKVADGQEKVRLSASFIIGTIMALAGMALVVFDGSSLHISPKGDVLALSAALCWGFYSVLMGIVADEYGSVFITRKVFFYGLLTIIPVLYSQGVIDLRLLLRPEVAGNLLFLGVVASLICYVLWNKVMAELGNVSSTNYIYLNPFFTLIFATIILGERLTPISAIGSVAIVLGVFFAGRTKTTS